MFGVDVFEFDAGIGLQLRLDDEPEDLAERLGRIHKDLLSAGRRSRTQAARYYDQAVEEFHLHSFRRSGARRLEHTSTV
jgi:hypothetical protein